MKLIILLTLIAFNCYSQDYPKFKSAKERCKTGHKCTARFYLDDFNDFEAFSSSTYLARDAFGKGLSVDFHKYISKDSSGTFMLTFKGVQEACVSDKAYVTILLKNGNKLKLDASSAKIDCGVNYITVDIQPKDIELLLKEPIDKVRMSYSDGYEDFTVLEKRKPIFTEFLKCIFEIK